MLLYTTNISYFSDKLRLINKCNRQLQKQSGRNTVFTALVNWISYLPLNL